MRYLIVSDLHANLEATQAVLDAAAPLGCGGVLVLGDLVGYGPDPEAVVACVRALPGAHVIRGNHDRVAVQPEGAAAFNPAARDAILWTRAQLGADPLTYLAGLPQGPLAIDEDTAICHGAPFDEDAYIFGPGEANAALRASTRRLLFFGHTHVAALYAAAPGLPMRVAGPSASSPYQVTLDPGERWLINPGSVGQPRDGDWRAAFGVLDTGAQTFTCHRVAYDAARTREKMRLAGLPASLIARIGPASLR